ncbi:MAG: nucleotidyltransferase domain-containing protein [Bacillota bacterium]|nr:nucleotidyltransferase domain-containing protein [Bacillota bacterium]MDI7250861.1 nucleotidyltransferase domain-containing protein [Bacillota bacterium]
MLREAFEHLVVRAGEEISRHYGERLVSLAVFGSVARGTPGPFSDIDLLVVADPLPVGRVRRVEEFQAIEDRLGEEIRALGRQGIHTDLAPVFKTPAEVLMGSPLFLDMVEEARILFDRGRFLSDYLAKLRRSLGRTGARKVRWRGAWYWDLTPHFDWKDVMRA